MTKKKQNLMPIKLDTSTLHAEDLKDVQLSIREAMYFISFCRKEATRLLQSTALLDYSGHAKLSDDVIRLQQNAKGLPMLISMVYDNLLNMKQEASRIQTGLEKKVEPTNTEE